jgi:hypothetical protein
MKGFRFTSYASRKLSSSTFLIILFTNLEISPIFVMVKLSINSQNGSNSGVPFLSYERRFSARDMSRMRNFLSTSSWIAYVIS